MRRFLGSPLLASTLIAAAATLAPSPLPGGGVATAEAAGSRVLFTAGRSLMAVGPHGGGLHRIARVPRRTADFAASENGRVMVTLQNRSVGGRRGALRQLYVIRPGRGARPVLRRPRVSNAADDIAVSPRGRLIAFGHDEEIWVVRPNGRGLRRATSGPGRADDPAFSPNGRWLYFTRATGRRFSTQVMRTRVRGGPERRLRGSRTRDDALTVSRRGRIAFRHVSASANRVQIRVMRLGRPGERAVADSHDPVFVSAPDFSPSGRSLVFTRGDWNGPFRLETVRATGGRHRIMLRGIRSKPRGLSWIRRP